MKTITKPVYGPDNLKYAANFEEIANLDEASEAAKKMGLTTDDVNLAFRKAKKLYYTAALESTPEKRLEEMQKALENTGAFNAEEIKVMVDSARAKAQSSLPAGLTPVLHPADHENPELRGKQIVGKPRGRAAAEKPAETVAA